MNEDRYDIDKLPIRDELRQKIKEKTVAEMKAIDMLQAVVRAQNLQDDYIEELIDKVLKEIKLLRKDINGRFKKIEKRVSELEGKVA